MLSKRLVQFKQDRKKETRTKQPNKVALFVFFVLLILSIVIAIVMDSAKLNDWMQVIGIFALVASLVFVGLQLKQSHEIALAEQYQSRTETTISYLTARLDQESDKSYLNSRIRWLIMDNNHFQQQQGFLTAESWQAYENFIRIMYSRCEDRRVVEDVKPTMRTSFVEFVESQGGTCTERE